MWVLNKKWLGHESPLRDSFWNCFKVEEKIGTSDMIPSDNFIHVELDIQ